MAVDTKDQKSTQAVATITANCGETAAKLLAADDTRFPEKKVRALVGTLPEYQRHVMRRALAGDTNPFRMTAATMLVYDTVKFGEVTSRLHRAVGLVRKEATLLTRAVERGKVPDRLADRLLTLDLIAEHAHRLRELQAGLKTVKATTIKPSQSSKTESALTDKLHAAGGLGLIAKNVRNVATLKSVHLPTPQQKEVALKLTADALKLAADARDAARRQFGRADAACQVQPTRTPTRRVITHTEVDGDAVAAAWLAERFLFADESVEVLFIPRNRAFGAHRAGDCLVDVGNTHDPANLFFDHKPPAFSNRHESCAARLVWDRLIKQNRPVGHLKPLVKVVHAGDSVRERAWCPEEYEESKRAGFHKALNEAKLVEATDAGVYRVIRRWLDAFHRRTVTRA